MLRRVFFLIVFSTSALASPPIPTKDIPRFQQVADGLFRGGQPGRQGFSFLKQQGVKTVINLTEGNGEERIVRSLGMNYVHIPLTVLPWTKIPDAEIRQFFDVVDKPSNFPVFVHCHRGADRTGAMVGFYRIAVQGWDGSRAINEARDIGMRWWYAGLKQQLYNFKPKSSLGLVIPQVN